jgi:hypothetical protein
MSLTVAIPFACYSRIENKKKATREPQVAKVHRWSPKGLCALSKVSSKCDQTLKSVS